MLGTHRESEREAAESYSGETLSSNLPSGIPCYINKRKALCIHSAETTEQEEVWLEGAQLSGVHQGMVGLFREQGSRRA